MKDLLINIKSMNKFKLLSVSYLDLNKEYKKIGKYKSGDAIPPFEMTGSSLLL